MWMRVFTILALSVITLHCCKTRNDRENIKVKSEESKYSNPINDTQLIVLAEYENNLNNLKKTTDWKEYEYEEEDDEQLENLQMWEQMINEDSLLKKVENNLQMDQDNHDDSKHQQKFETLKTYMSKNCLKDFDIFLSMNHEDEWEKYHNEIMQLETQYREWEKNDKK